MLNIAQDFKNSQGIDKDRIYQGSVVNNNDPLKLCRVKVQIPVIFEGINDEDLPWAIPMYSHADGATSTSGNVAIPKIGSKVTVKFQDGNAMFPMYGGYSVDKTTIIEESKHNYPNRHVQRFSNGCLMIVDTQSNEVFFRNVGDLKIYVQGNVNLNVDGNCIERVKGNKELQVDGNYVEIIKGNKTVAVSGNSNHSAAVNNMFADGASTVKAGGTLALEGSVIHENSGVGAAAPAAPSSPGIPSWPGIPESDTAKIPKD